MKPKKIKNIITDITNKYTDISNKKKMYKFKNIILLIPL